ncbi:hypothetical protein NMD1_03347 [Novosphingobium sp. MD-1]|nr:hypothetical protein NMD1_03347 [Novosphingobium sp. MD-1]
MRSREIAHANGRHLLGLRSYLQAGTFKIGHWPRLPDLL